MGFMAEDRKVFGLIGRRMILLPGCGLLQRISRSLKGTCPWFLLMGLHEVLTNIINSGTVS